MANTKFSRDEAILTLDVLYYSGKKLKRDSDTIEELSEILNLLPIHSKKNRRENFRNPSGVYKQIQSFARSYKKGIKDPNVGMMFYQVANEFSDRMEELHSIAIAIRKNRDLYSDFQFGCDQESYDFPEGALLGHLHRMVEMRDGSSIEPEDRCSICHIKLSEIYCHKRSLMSLHLTTPITEIDGNNKYKDVDFLTVCPNCHAALHQYRPWLSKDKAKDILKQ